MILPFARPLASVGAPSRRGAMVAMWGTVRREGLFSKPFGYALIADKSLGIAVYLRYPIAEPRREGIEASRGASGVV